MLQEGKSRLVEHAVLMSVLADEGGSAPRVGADLRAARERIGYTLEEVAVGLRIRLSYLQALEDGRIEDLPGSAYALGFLRTYAEALGLDGDEISRRFKYEADGITQKILLDFPAPNTRPGIPVGAMVLLGLVLAVGVYIGWYKLSGDGRLPAEAVAPVPARLAQLGSLPIFVPSIAPPQIAATPLGLPALNATTPLGVPSAGASAPAPGASPIAPSQAAAAIPLPPPAPPLPGESVAAAPPVAAPQAPAPLASSLPLAPLPLAPSTQPASIPAGDGRIVVRVTTDVWIQVREHNGPVIFNRVLKSGETYGVPARPGLLFTTGNAIATEFLVDGTLSTGLGGVKGVRRDLSLDADALRDGRLAAQLGGNPNVTRAQ
ncbi:MAG: helix-turn-helix domain-containing protein [Acetobacteraceae bacterium]|nr:helix-turn-helix domain-containing protein [Acetobacteraceae bacterium]